MTTTASRTSLTTEELRALYDFEKESRLVADALRSGAKSTVDLLRFMTRYASWNGFFGSGVATLAGKIGRSRRLFTDAKEPVSALSDRAVLVASYFFDAARDEFDDRDTSHRDTHRCLAQAMLHGMIDFGREQGDAHFGDVGFLNALQANPLWLNALQNRVALGYGNASTDTRPSIFRAIGYHLGSEVLADQEFSVLHHNLREMSGNLVRHLLTYTVDIAGQMHKGFQWIAIHSSHGGGAEAEHFEWATRGARLAFEHSPEAEHLDLRRQLHLGFLDFVRDHREFFEQVNVA